MKLLAVCIFRKQLHELIDVSVLIDDIITDMKPEANLSGVRSRECPSRESNRSAEYVPSENNQESGIENGAERDRTNRRAKISSS